MMAENESTDPGFEPVPGSSAGPGGSGNPVSAHPDEMPEQQLPDPSGQDDSADYDDPGAAVPSVEAEMDESNTEDASGRPFSSEPERDAAGIPDGSGTDLPDERSPQDREDGKETFDAG